MNQPDQHLEDIKVIKKIMEESSRFLSLSGLSGIVAGLLAIAGAVVANLIITGTPAAEEWYSVPLTADPAWHRSDHPSLCRHGSSACTVAGGCGNLFLPQGKEKRTQRMDTRHPQDAGKPSPSAGNGRALHSHDTQQGSRQT